MVSGPVPGTPRPRYQASAMLTAVQLDPLQDDLKIFWELDAMGIKDVSETDFTPEEKYAVQQFEESVSFDGER